jgi:hypothetical protein
VAILNQDGRACQVRSASLGSQVNSFRVVRNDRMGCYPARLAGVFVLSSSGYPASVGHRFSNNSRSP